MKIMHAILSNIYVDKVTYQENLLSRQNKLDGHEVLIVASCQTLIDGKLSYIKPKKYKNEDDIEVIRLRYKVPFFKFLNSKIRIYSGFKEIMHNYKPDVIFFHGIQSFDLLTAARYKRHNPKVKLYVDTHSDRFNSGKTFISKYFLHKLYYKLILRFSYASIDRIYYINYESKDFYIENYNLPLSKLHFMPLGGIIYTEEVIEDKYKIIRERYALDDDKIVLIHTGKMNKRKKTLELVKCFVRLKSNRLRLILIGSISDDIYIQLNELIKDDIRVIKLDWIKGTELIDFLCASDIYIQPGTQSATLQNAICCKCAVVVYPYDSHHFLIDGNGYYVSDEKELSNILVTISELRVSQLSEMKKKSYMIGKTLLDYKIIAKNIYE